MDNTYDKQLILEKENFTRSIIDERIEKGGFNSIERFEIFIWDIEMFLQFQKRLGDKIVLKGGAAAQFYIPITAQRTSIDIDMICMADRDELHNVITHIEMDFNNDEDYFKLRLHTPANPKVNLDTLETYYVTVPSICNEKELYKKSKQEVKVEILFTDHEYPIYKIKQPDLFALETINEFNILSLECLFADKLTTIGPNTIGITEERKDEYFKQIYDLITLFTSNSEYIISGKEKIKEFYFKAAIIECRVRSIPYEPDRFIQDMMMQINRIRGIEGNDSLYNLAKNFQSLYLNKAINRNKAEWAIVGCQLGLLIKYIFYDNTKISGFREIEDLIKKYEFKNIEGPERGNNVKLVHSTLEKKYKICDGLSIDLFKKRLDRIIWELLFFTSLTEISDSLEEVFS
jgi:predicted nucleotidyltransferase component of viral defense system